MTRKNVHRKYIVHGEKKHQQIPCYNKRIADKR